MAQEFETFDNGSRGFRATQVGGPDVDLVALAGLSFLQELIDELVPETNWEGILAECGTATIVEEEDFEDGPGQSDTFYRVEVDDLPGFRSELKAEWLARLDQSLQSESRRCRGMKSGRPQVSVELEWGHDVQACPMALDTFRQVLKGQPITRARDYWYEGKRYRGEWAFNETRSWELRVRIPDGGDGFAGELSDAIVRLVDGQ